MHIKEDHTQERNKRMHVLYTISYIGNKTKYVFNV